MDKTFWDTRYAESDYAYGTNPNDLLKENSGKIKPGSEILCLAEGEGRNAAFLAERGHKITAIDYSESGLKKLNSLAKEKGVKIETICVDLNEYTLEDNKWDAIICIFGHFPSELRRKLFSRIYPSLRQEGLFLLEAYSKQQVQFKTGGPQSADLLYSVHELTHDLKEFNHLEVKLKERFISEGKYHHGMSSVIQIIANK
jgi:cyclopropane fatty-acyl-phospholipid synthase-like methyltransferase